MARRKLPKGIREKNGSYEARAKVNGKQISIYGKDLEKLIEEFEDAKQRAIGNVDYKKDIITLNEWFEEWFINFKSKYVKETSIRPMKNAFKRTFGFYLGNSCRCKPTVINDWKSSISKLKHGKLFIP